MRRSHDTLKFRLYLTVSLSCLMLSTGAYAVTEMGEISHLAPMPGPDQRNIGWEWHFVDQDGNTGFMRKVAGDQQQASYTRTDGCEWTRSTAGFAPATEWKHCPSSGAASVELIEDNIWPLKVGNTFDYTVKGKSSLLPSVWRSKRACKVVGQLAISIHSGTYDTFKVVCTERWGTRTWWLSPVVGTAVAYQQKTKRGEVIIQEMTKIVSP